MWEAQVQSELLPGVKYGRSPCQQMATRLLLFVKCGPLVDKRESILADKFLLGVYIK